MSQENNKTERLFRGAQDKDGAEHQGLYKSRFGKRLLPMLSQPFSATVLVYPEAYRSDNLIPLNDLLRSDPTEEEK
jgi:hypothetical protein